MIFHKIVGIAACDPIGIMGKAGKLPWRKNIEEIDHFSRTISKAPLVMGYRTFLSLPAHYFEKHNAIVFSRKRFSQDQNSSLIFLSSLEEFETILAERVFLEPIYVIGGAQIFELFFIKGLLSEVILTIFNDRYEGDVFFPLLRLSGWPSLKIRETPTFNIHHYFTPLEVKHADKDL